ncbi:MAG: hypothetical protein IJQ44_06050 [Bacteroidaceae bacterium]|nr:hypothetical protein [Bacteroidaceae bacterium]
MKRSFCFICIPFLCFSQCIQSAEADTYHPFVEEGKVWKVAAMGVTLDAKQLRIYTMSGDTVIGEYNCKKWSWKQTDCYGTVLGRGVMPPVFEVDKKVYFIPKGTERPFLYYDFGMAEGDTITVYDINDTLRTCELSVVQTFWSDDLHYPQSGHLPVQYVSTKPMVNLVGGWIQGVGFLRSLEPSYKPILDGGKLEGPTMIFYCAVGNDTIFRSKAFFQIGMENFEKTYRPLVVEGKHWTYDNFLPTRPDQYNHYYWYDLKGDTVIAGQECKKLYSKNLYNSDEVRYEGALYETDKRVYCFPAGKEEAALMYAFGCEVGDKLNTTEGTLTVSGFSTMQNGERELRVTELSIDAIQEYVEEWEELKVRWIEGVGCVNDFFSMLPYPGNYCSLTACDVNGDTLYQYIQPELTEKGYHKMGIEGKTWNYVHHFEDENGVHEEPYSYVVKGDTMVDRTIYKKVYYKDAQTERFAFILMEYGRSVSRIVPGANHGSSMYDFGRHDIGRVFDWNSEYGRGRVYWMLDCIDTISVRGQDFRRLTFFQKTIEGGSEGMLSTVEDGEDTWREIWVEGVGSQLTGIEPPKHEAPPVSNDYTRFVSCYENGVCIFTAEDFTSVIHDLPAPQVANDNSNNGIFDLSGRRLTNGSGLKGNGSGLPNGIYIENGRKRVSR